VYYESVLAALNRNRVRYLVIGGLAVNLHGVPRLTADLDIAVDLSRSNLRRVIRALEPLGYHPRVPVAFGDFVSEENRQRWQKEKGMVVFSVARADQDPLTVDIMIDCPIDFEVAYQRRVKLRADDLRVPVVALEDLIALKRVASRRQDLADIRALRVAKGLKGRAGRQ
jgi:predicted nucleotidyltransferase